MISQTEFPGGGTFRLLHVIGATAAGGAEHVAVDLACQVARIGHRVAVFALSGRTDATGDLLRQELMEAGVEFACGPPGLVRLSAVLRLAREVRRFRPEIIHLHTPNTELAMALVSFVTRRVRVARTIHSTIMAVRRLPLYRWAFRRNQVAISVACSSAVAEANREWADPLFVIRNGVNFDWPVQTPQERQAACKNLGLDPTKRHFLMVGNMSGSDVNNAAKAQDVMITSWKGANKQGRNAELHFLGNGQLRPQLERLAAGDDTIRFWGVSPRVSDWLLATDVFVMPSRFEGLPMAGIEALGTGLPCIFSDIPPLRELEPLRVLWVAPGEVSSLTSAVDAALTTEFMGDAADAHRIRASYGSKRMVDEYVRYYTYLLAIQPED